MQFVQRCVSALMLLTPLGCLKARYVPPSEQPQVQAAASAAAGVDFQIDSAAIAEDAPLEEVEWSPAVSSEKTETPSDSSQPSEYEKVECGEASFYGADFAGRPTANGEIFDPGQFTAAHRTLPFGTQLVVTRSGEEPTSDSLVVRINDRGPFIAGRMIDLSTAAFRKLAAESLGILSVCIYTEP